MNLNANMVKNLLASFEAQQGLSGPMSSIVTSLGAHLPRPNDS